MVKEPWDSSSVKAKTLNISDFGKCEKVKEMAKPIRVYAPLEFDKKIIPVKITVKEYKDETLGKRLYSIEAINFELR